MKILKITSYGYEAGGTENGIILLQPHLERMGHEVRTLASSKGPEKGRFNTYAFKPLSDQPMLLKLLYRAFYPEVYRATKKVLTEYQPDVVQIHTTTELSSSVLFALKGYPVIQSVHGAEDFTPGLLLWAFPTRFFNGRGFTYDDLTFFGWLHYWYHTYVSGFAFKLGFAYVQKFLVFSSYMQRLLAADGIDAVCIPNATRLFDARPIDTNSRIIAFVGRLEKIKGVQDIIEALPNVLRVHPGTKLCIAGDGDYKGDLVSLVERLGLGAHVEFLGHKTRDELYDLYTRSAVVLMPSVWPEPFGKVGIEAMSVGRPVIACDVGGISEWLRDGETGYLVPPNSPDAIAEKILTLFGDSSRMQAFSDAAALHAREFSIDLHAQRLIALYQSVIDACATPEKKASPKEEIRQA